MTHINASQPKSSETDSMLRIREPEDGVSEGPVHAHKGDEALGNVIKPSVLTKKTEREVELAITSAKLHIQQKMIDAKTGERNGRGFVTA